MAGIFVAKGAAKTIEAPKYAENTSRSEQPQANVRKTPKTAQNGTTLPGQSQPSKSAYNPMDDIMHMLEPKAPTQPTKQYVTGNAALDAWRSSVNTLANERKEKEAKAKAEAEQKEYKQLQSRLDRIDANRAYVTTTEQNDALEKERASVVQRMREIDGGTTSTGLDERLKKLFAGTGLERLGSDVGAMRGLYEAGQKNRTAQYQQAYDELQPQIARAQTAYNEMRALYGEAGATAEYNVLKDLQRRSDAYKKVLDENIQQRATAATSEMANSLTETGGAKLEEAKQGLDPIGRLGVDAASAGLNMLYDAALGRFGGSTLSNAAMGLRSFGQTAQAAEASGADIDRQIGAGVAAAAKTVITNGLVDGLAGLYGKGAADDIIEMAVGKLGKTDAGKNALRALAKSAGEGAEELVDAKLDPLVSLIYDNGEALKQKYGSGWQGYKEAAADDLYSALIGFALGAAGQGVSAAKGDYARANAEIGRKASATEEFKRGPLPYVEWNPDISAEERARIDRRDLETHVSGENSSAPIQQPQTRANVQEGNLAPATPADVKQGGSDELNSALNLNSRDATAEEQKNTAPMQETSNTTQEIRATENNNAAFSNANVQGDYSVERNDAGSVTIRINNSILAGQPQKAWAGIVKQKIQEIFSGGLDLPRGTIFSNKKGRGEFTNGSYTKMLERTQPELYRAKMGMTPGTGAMVGNASDVRFESPAHERADDIVGFNRGNIRVIVEGEGYTGDVLTAVYSDGKEVFFDVNNIAKEKGEAPSERYAARNSGFSQADGASTSEDFSSDTSIPTTGRNVNSENGGNAVRERGFSKNVRTDSAMDAKLRETFDASPEMYAQLANKDTLAKAREIFSKGLNEARSEVEQALGAAKNGSKLAPEMVPLARMVANELSRGGDVESARRITADVATELTAAGQLNQAARLLRDADPNTALAAIQKSIDAINAEFAKQHKRSNWKAELTKAETEKILSTDFTEDGAYERVYDEIATRLGKEMPSSVLEKLTEIRRINMLLRPRTQIKNVASNVPMIGLRKGAETLSIGIQSALTKTGLMDEAKRTRAWASREQRQLAKDYYEANKADINGQSNKWDFKSALREKRTIFKGGAIEKAVSKMTGKEIDSFGEALRQVTYSCLEAGDAPFVKSAFVDSLAQYCAAKGITDSKNITQEAIDFATVNAMEATFKNANFIADVVNQVKRNSSPALSAAVDILIPFTTTPANILSLMGDYSPIGFGKMFAKDGVAAKIDAFSKASVGTAVMALGLALRSAGIITGGEDDDKDKAALDKATGQGTYSIGGKVSYDWAQPAGSLLAFGAEIADAIKGQESWLSAFMNAIYTAGDATLNLSLFQNVVSVLRGSGKPTQQIVDAIMEGGATQLVPGLAGDIAKIIDGTVRSTYTGGNVFADIGAKVLSNTPILSQKLPESVNVKGEANTRGGFAERAVNILLNPTNTTSGKRNAVDEEIYRLYDATGSTVFFPSVSPYKIEYANQTYTMDGKDRETFQKVQGRTYYELAQPLLSSEMYKALSDDQKASVLKSIRDYALDAAKRQFVDGRGGEYSNDQWDPVDELTKGQISAYIPAKQALKDGANGNGGRKTFEAIDLLLDGYKKLPGAVQDKLNGEKLNVANLLYADSKGIGSKAWYDTHNAIDGTSAVAAASSVSRNFKGSDEEKLNALRTMNSYTMPDKETGKQSAIVRRYEAAMNYGVSFDDWTRLEETVVNMFGSGTPNKSEIYAAAKEALPDIPRYKVYSLYKKDSDNENKVDFYDEYFASLYEPTGGKVDKDFQSMSYEEIMDVLRVPGAKVVKAAK